MSTPAPEAPATPAAESGTTIVEAPGAAPEGASASSETAQAPQAPATPESAPESHPEPQAPEVLSDGKDVRKAAVEAAQESNAKLGRTDAAKAGAQAVADLPDWAQRIIKDTREEAAKTRVDAKTHAEKAASQARDQFAQDIGRALGLIKDDAEGGTGDEIAPPTAEELLGQVAAEKESTRMARVELAIYKAAASHQADPLALLDSRAFLDVVKSVDPSDSEALANAIKAAVESNPRLRLEEVAPAAAEPEPTPPPSGGSFAGGPSGRGNDVTDMSIDDFRKSYAANRRR